MDLTGSFDALSAVIERYESAGQSVRDVEASAGDGELLAELEVAVGLCSGGRPAATPRTASLTEDGGLRVEFDPPGLPDLPPEFGSAVAADVQAVSVADACLVRTVELRVAPDAATGATADTSAPTDGTGRTDPESGADDGESGERTDRERAAEGPGGERAVDGRDGEQADTAADGTSAADPLAAVRDESVPPYEDVPYLERLYETADTFVEMSRRIDMEVSSETVRRYMIEADVHSPTAYGGEESDEAGETTSTGPETDAAGQETAEDPADPTATLPDEQLVADGVGLPADLRVADIVDAVVGSTTVYEVHRRLGIDQTRTRDLLGDLNLLDLVMRRVAHASDQEITEEVVASRIRECVTDEA